MTAFTMIGPCPSKQTFVLCRIRCHGYLPRSSSKASSVIVAGALHKDNTPPADRGARLRCNMRGAMLSAHFTITAGWQQRVARPTSGPDRTVAEVDAALSQPPVARGSSFIMCALIVRSATPADVSHLAQLWYEKTVLLQQADPRVRMAENAHERWMAAACAWLEQPLVALLIADDDGEVAGYIVARVEPGPPGLLPEKRGVIADIAVDAHRYRPGVARRLVQAAQSWLAEQNVHEMLVNAPRRDAVAQAFWRSLGAREWMDGLWMKF